MTYLEWKNDVLGRFIEVAGSANAKNQCVDCANDFIKRVLNLPYIEWTNAIDFPQHAGDNYNFVWNTPDALPIQGALMIFDIGEVGHISVYDEGNLIKFRSVDENYPIGSPCKVVEHNYNNVVGWLIPKSGIIDTMTLEEQKLLDIIKDKGLTENDLRWVADLIQKQSVPNYEKEIASLKEEKHEYEISIQGLLAEITEYQKDVANKQSEIDSAKKQLENKINELETMTNDRNKYKGYYENALKDQVNKYTAWELIKLGLSKLFIKK